MRGIGVEASLRCRQRPADTVSREEESYAFHGNTARSAGSRSHSPPHMNRPR